MWRILTGLALVVLVLVSQIVFTLGEWEQGIVVQFGNPKRILTQPGLYVKLPLVQNLIRLDKRLLTTDAREAEYITLDKKRVVVDHVSRWRIVEPLEFYRSVRDPLRAMARLDDIIFGRLRREIARHNYLDLVREQRENIMEVVSSGAHEGATAFGIEVLDVRIKRLDLPREVQASVFARMRAERERIAKRYRGEGEEQARKIRAEADKEREIIVATAYETAEKLRGKGDAEATTIYADSFGQDPEFYAFTRRLQTYEKSFASDTTLVLRPDSDLLRYLQSPLGE